MTPDIQIPVLLPGKIAAWLKASWQHSYQAEYSDGLETISNQPKKGFFGPFWVEDAGFGQPQPAELNPFLPTPHFPLVYSLYSQRDSV